MSFSREKPVPDERSENRFPINKKGQHNSEQIERTALLEQVDQLWMQDEADRAFQMLREARLEHGPSSELQYAYGRRAFEKGYYWAAREALHDAIDLDPTNLDAVELFLEVNHIHPAVKGTTTNIILNIADLLPSSSDFDVEAASVLLPSMSLVEAVDQKIRMLRYSENPVAKHIGVLAASVSSEWSSSHSETEDERIAKLIVTLSRREYDQAYPLLDSIKVKRRPKRALRLAIQREIRSKNIPEARVLLTYLRNIEPDNERYTSQWSKILNESSYLSASQIIAHGFPFPPSSDRPSYEPDYKRVLYLLHSSLPYHSVGYATRTHGLLQGIRDHGWDVRGVTRLGYPYDMPGMEAIGPIASSTVIDGVPYYRLSVMEGTEKKQPIEAYIARYAESVKALAMEHQPFVVHAASNHWNGLAGVTAARELGIPSIYEVRGLWEITRGSRNPDWAGGTMYKYMARLEADAASSADKVITITHALREELVRRGVDENKITVVPNGVDPQRFVPREKDRKLARQLGVENKVVVGYVGSILNYEGIGLLIDAAARLNEERDDVAFLLVGDGAELEEYQARVIAEGLDSMVKFTGRVPHEEVEAYYSLIDISPFPRLPLPVCEIVSPLKPFEAMAMGKAVIASDVKALAEVVTDHQNGLLFRKGDADDLTRSIRLLIDAPRLRHNLADAGRRWVKTERDWTNLAEQIDEIYKSIILSSSETRLRSSSRF